MQRFNSLTLSQRLIIFIGSAVVLVTFLSTLYNYQTSRQYIESEAKLRSAKIVNDTVNELVRMLAGVQKSTDLLASVVIGFEGEEASLQALLKNTVTTNPNIYGGTIALAPAWSKNKKGFAPYYHSEAGELKYANLATLKYNYSQQAWFTQADIAGKPQWSEPYFDDGGGNILMTTYSVPIYRQDKNGVAALFAVITGDVSLNRIQEKIQAIKLGDTGHAMLFSNKGLLLSYPDTSFIMQPISRLLGDASEEPLWKDTLSSMFNGESKLLKIPCIEGDKSKDDCIFAYGSLDITGWPIAVLFPEDEMFAELHQYTLQFSMISAAIIIILLALIGFITAKLTRPLNSLSTASDQIGHGNFDVELPSIKRDDEVGKLIQAFTRMQQALKHYIAELEAETATKNRLQGELSAAHQIQMSMLPGNGEILSSHAFYQLWAKLIPAKSVGGDLYQFSLQQNHKLIFIVGDVSDKGVPAALFMAKTTSLFKQQINSGQSPELIMYQINNALVENNDACMFVTLFYAELNLLNGEMVYVSAGHHSPILIRDSQVIEMEQQGGAALGLLDDMEYVLNKTTLQAKDKLFIYTDGIDEAFNPQREMFGLPNLLNFLQLNQTLTVDNIGIECLNTVKDFTAGEEQSDDITVMALEFQPTFEFLIEADISETHYFHLRPELVAIETCFTQITEFSQQQGFPESLTGTMKLVAEEVLVNAIQYGCAKTEEDLYFVLGITDSAVLMEFIDPGFVYNPLEEAPEPNNGEMDEIQIGGLGVHFVKSISQKQQYQRKGLYNHLCILLEHKPA
ncbi:MAG: SpoIIE family protein phosphatase [Pseudomonadales bacterium]|nr:SpoIIE family protein phosphatase [Pseudomonadales bacterium]